MGKKPTWMGDVVGPGEATDSHVVVQRLDQLSARPCRQVEVARLQCGAQLTGDVVACAGTEARSVRREPARETLCVQWPGRGRPFRPPLSCRLMRGIDGRGA